MPFSELELKRIDRTVGELCRRSTRPEHADQLRFEWDIKGHTVTIWEVRPPWDGVGKETRMGVARFRFFRSRGVWQTTGCAETSSGTATTILILLRLPIWLGW